MLLAIDIGNTNIHVGIFDSAEIKCTFDLGTDENRTPDEYSLFIDALMSQRRYQPTDVDGVILGSVVPTVTGKIEAAVQKIIDAPIITVGPGIKTGFSIKIDDPAELGADLAANAAGAISEVGYPAFIIDFGTATTVSVVDDKKAFTGCSIMPGIQMSLNALNGTGLLPGVSADKPLSPLGKNTVESMRSGVIRGQAMSVMGFIDLYKKESAVLKDAPIILTGGSAEKLIPYLSDDVRYIPNLTLKGLYAIYSANKKK